MKKPKKNPIIPPVEPEVSLATKVSPLIRDTLQKEADAQGRSISAQVKFLLRTWAENYNRFPQ